MLAKALVSYTVVLFLLSIGNGEKPRPFSMELFDMQCLNYTPILQTFDCNLVLLAPSFYSFTQHIQLTKDMTDFDARVQVDVEWPQTKRNVRMVDVRINVCKSLELVWNNPLLHRMLSELKRTSNIHKDCPYKKGTVYKIDNFSVTTAFFPPYATESNFKFRLEFIFEEALLAVIDLKGALKWKKVSKKRNQKG